MKFNTGLLKFNIFFDFLVITNKYEIFYIIL